MKSCGNNAKRIAVLLPDLRGGGAEMLRLRMAHLLAKRGYEPEFWLRNARGELLASAQAEFPIFDLKAERIRHMIVPLARLWKDRRPAAVLADMWPNTVVAATCYAILRRLGVRSNLVLCDHNTLSLTPETRAGFGKHMLSLTTRLCYPWANHRVAVSAGVAKDLSKISGIGVGKFEVVYNSGFSELRTHAPRNPWPNVGLKILMVGSLKEQKNHALALKAFAKLGRRDACLAILGEGELRASIEFQCRELGIEDQVLLKGYETDTQGWYSHADLFLLTSSWEGFGIVLVEALQYGLQIVSTDCSSGPSEILENGRYGFLVPLGDCDSLVSAIQQAISNPIPAKSLQCRAEAFSPDRMTERYLRLLVGDL